MSDEKVSLTLETRFTDKDMEIAKRLADLVGSINGCDMGTAFVSHGALPGLQVLPSNQEAVRCAGAVVKSKELGFLFVHTDEDLESAGRQSERTAAAESRRGGWSPYDAYTTKQAAEDAAAGYRSVQGRIHKGSMTEARVVDQGPEAGRLRFSVEVREGGGVYSGSRAPRGSPGRVSIADIMAANKNAGHHFFDKDAMRFFNSRTESDGLEAGGRVFFVTSEQFDEKSPRKFKVREMDMRTGFVKPDVALVPHNTREEALRALTDAAARAG